MARRSQVDFGALTSEQAVPLPEAVQRMAPASVPSVVLAPPSPPPQAAPKATTKTANLEALAFKVPPEFRRRFRQRAAAVDLKLNELLFAAFEAWEEKNGFKA